MSKTLQTATLTGWKFVDYGSVKFLTGTVTGHPLLADGEFIHTSMLLNLDFLRNKAVTLNTIYDLVDQDNENDRPEPS